MTQSIEKVVNNYVQLRKVPAEKISNFKHQGTQEFENLYSSLMECAEPVIKKDLTFLSNSLLCDYAGKLCNEHLQNCLDDAYDNFVGLMSELYINYRVMDHDEHSSFNHATEPLKKLIHSMEKKDIRSTEYYTLLKKGLDQKVYDIKFRPQRES